MINLADKLTAKTVEGILADSQEIKYTREMGTSAKDETVAKELSNMTDSMSELSGSVTTLSLDFGTAQSNIEQLLNKAKQYTDRFVDNPIANRENAGLMSSADKTKLDSYPDNPQDISGTGQAEPWIDIDWSGHNMNEFINSGEYYIHGNRTDNSDNLPIINVGGGHTINARLTVLNSSLSLTEVTNNNDTANSCVTQILRLSNRKGGDGHVYVRTGQGKNKDNLTWSTWEKLMGIFEKNNVLNIEDIDSYTTNGMYSGIYASESMEYGGIQFFQLDTFLIITINGYAVSKLATPQITQLLYKLPAKAKPLDGERYAEIYIRTGFLDANGWSWGPFLKTVTNMDLDSQVATLNENINVVSNKAKEAEKAATEAKKAADTATRMLRFSSIIYDANIEEQNAPSPKFQIVFVRAKGIFVASDGGKYYKVFPGSDDYNITLDGVTKARQDRLYFIQSLDENRYYHYDGVALRHLTTSETEIAGRVWNEDNATPKAESYYGSLKALRDLPKRLGLGRYLVTDDRKRKKLDPNDSKKYLDGSPAALDGSEGQCMWCWNGFYANVWHEGSRLIKAVTFDGPVGGETSVWIPAGGISWLGVGVMDRKENKLCSIISDPALYGPEFDKERYIGGAGVALDASKYTTPPSDSPQITMLGMPAIDLSTTQFGEAARNRGEGWEANWFVARFVVEFLFEVIMGTENSQEGFNNLKDANGLYQGGFNSGVTVITNWNGYNNAFPVIPTSVGLNAGDGVCLVPYELPKTNGVYTNLNVPVFFGLVGAGFGNLIQLVRGLIINVGNEKSQVYVTKSMYDTYYSDRVDDKNKIPVSECPRVSGYIMRKSYKGLCCMPTKIGGSNKIRFSDKFNASVKEGLYIRSVGGHSDEYDDAGTSYTNMRPNEYKGKLSSAPLCYFEEDPIIPESEKIEL